MSLRCQIFSVGPKHPDLWLVCLIRSSNAGRALNCKVTTHFPDNCPQSSFYDSKSTHTPSKLENPFHLYVASSTKIATPEPPVTTNTSAYPVKATTLESTATKTRVNLPGNNNPRPNIKCDNVRPVARGGAVGANPPPSQIKGPLFKKRSTI